MRREEVLEYETRRRVYDLIRDEPGLHLRELERRGGVPLSTLRHHLRYLEEHSLVESEDDRNVVRYFATALVTPVDRRMLGALRQEALRRVVLYILARGGVASYRDIVGDLGLPSSTLGVHLAELTRRNLVERRQVGRESRYELRDVEPVIRLLHTYRASFLDALVDHLLDAVYRDDSR